MFPHLLGKRGPGRYVTPGGAGDADGGFEEQPVATITASGNTTINGKVKPGSFGKFVFPLTSVAAGRQYTFRYDPDFSRLAQQGKLAMVGFGLKSGNDFHIVGMRGDGSTGLKDYEVYGTPPNGWNKDTGHTTSQGSTPTSGTQAGPNYIRLITSSDGTTIQFQTSPDGSTWTTEYTDYTPSPFTNVSQVTTFGIALWFNNADAGPFSIVIDQFAEVSIDPYYGNVVLLWEAEGTDGQTTSITEARFGRAITALGTAHIESDQARYGSTSFYVGTAGGSLADNDDWTLATVSGDSYTIEFSIRQGTIASQWDVLNQTMWLTRVQSTGELTFYWSPTGSGYQSFTTSGAGLASTNTWYDICIEKNSSNKIRVYVNGVMKGSSTPAGADSVIFNGAYALLISTHESNAGYFDHVRITKGVARYNNDSGYTPGTGAFPTNGPTHILDGTSPTGAWSMSRDLLSSFAGGTRYTTATGVDSLKDQTANAANFNQSGTGVQPAVSTAGPNSRACADFDGSDDYLQANKNISTQITASDMFYIVSFIVDAISTDTGTFTNNQAIVADNGGYTGLAFRTSGSPGPSVQGYHFDTNYDSSSQISISTGTAYVFSYRHTGGTVYISKNGAAEVSFSSGNTGNGDLAEAWRIGKALSTPMDGKFFEMAIWNSGSTPDATTRAAIITDFMNHIGAT